MRFLVLLVALALLILAAGCTTQSPQATDIPATTSAPVTTTVPTTLPTTVLTTLPTTVPTPRPTTILTTPVKRFEVKVNDIQKYVSDNQYAAPRSGYEYLLVDFSIKNVGLPSGYSFNPNYAKLEDPDGYRYSYASHSYSVPGAFESVVIRHGDTVRGKLLFEVPPMPVGTDYTLWVS